MRKIVLLILSLLVISGCGSSEYNDEKKEYDSIVEKINNVNSFHSNEELDFNIDVIIDKIIEDEIIYRIIIDEPKKPIYNIKALVIHDAETSDVFPNTGIFEEELNLIPNEIDENKNNVKGIILIGYIPYNKDIETFNCNFKVYISYDLEDGKHYERFYYYQK